jgi:hypothetical protein
VRPYWLSGPGRRRTRPPAHRFDAVLAAAPAAGQDTAIDYRLAARRWQFLDLDTHLARIEADGGASNGSGSPSAIDSCSATRSRPVTASVTGCSTCSRAGRFPVVGRRRDLTAGAGRGGSRAGSVPDRAWPERALLHTVRS